MLDDKWTLERLLGVGGMAAVYGARHRNGARAAVKVLHPDLSRHKEVRERFLREGYAANRVEHAGAVKVLDDDVVASGPEAGTAYIVMELLEGESLQERLERGPPLGELGFLAIAGSVLEVLEAAHARGVVHRDLKPENLFLIREGEADAVGPLRVKVLDFGLARLLQGDAITSYGLALGTPSFMSPEQAAGRTDEIDGRTDLFALAATGFRLCTGRRIHEAPSPVDLVLKMAHLPAPRVRSIRPDVSEPCARVIDRALEFRREDRYENAGAMLEDVRRAVIELDARGPTWLAVPAIPLASPPAPPVPRGPPEDQTILELSEGDLQDSSKLALDESIRLPKQRSVLPWLALLVFAAVGVKVLWSARRAPSSSGDVSAVAPAPEPGDAAAAPGASARVPVIVRDRDASTDPQGTSQMIAGPSPSASSNGARPSPSIAPPTNNTRPAKVGPGNVHKLPRKHRQKKPRANQ